MDETLLQELTKANFAHQVYGLEKGLTFYPSLDTVIEACGEEFFCLERKQGTNTWVAVGHRGNKAFVCPGTTAVEAATRLWLALR